MRARTPWRSLLVGLLAAGPLGACPLVTSVLGGADAAEGSFPRRLKEISDLMQGMFYDTGYDREAAKVNSSRALELWMEIYLQFYLRPPEEFRQMARWQDVMDSMTGPIRRIRTYARQEDYYRGHHQLRVLQDSFTEFYGDPLPKKAARLGPVWHTIETLQFIEGSGPDVIRERAARTRLLRDRYDTWLAGFPARAAGDPKVVAFAAALKALEAAAEGGDEAVARAAVETVATRAGDLTEAALALQWGTP